ncbi:hypothetical protein [Bradyrhizobium sp. CER78]|uniref:hypothetical protein n=1 Tax=Bradyrhizobium sp. CER78 TaxID=3039162 RepID=UPI002449A335|nr:hypothetical protein [Bradyrhizobium sp. CER78]MDH2386352.1 hypothetical protein [Bradyrhizobium sp. CER78]
MRKRAGLIAIVAINASTVPSLAAECISNKDIHASCARWPTVQSQPADAADKERNCHAYAASIYEPVMLRQVAAERVEGERVLDVLDSGINAFNDLLATKCGG